MADQSEKLLAPIREICQKIISRDSIVSYVDELKKIADKGKFYYHSIFNMLIDLLKNNSNIDQNKIIEIFNLLRYIHNKSGKSKLSLVPFYNFAIVKVKENVSDVLIQQFVRFIELTEQPSPETLKIYFVLTEYFSQQNRIYKVAELRKIINFNFGMLIRSAIDDKEYHEMLMKSLGLPVKHYYFIENNWTHSVEFLTNTVYKELKECNMKIEDDKAFREYIDFIPLTSYFKYPEMTKIMCKIIEQMGKFFTSKEHINLNNMLLKCLTVLSSAKIDEKCVNDIYQECFKDAQSSSKNVTQHKVLLFLTRQISNVASNMELTETCYSAVHEIIFKLFNLLKYIKYKEEKFKRCCEDIKRHAIISLAEFMLTYGYNLVSIGIFSRKIKKYLQYYIDYVIVLCKDLACSTKEDTIAHIIHEINLIVYNLLGKRNLESSNLNFVAQNFKTLIHLHEKHNQNNEKALQFLTLTGSTFNLITYEKTTENAQVYADVILYSILMLLKKRKDEKENKIIVKLVFNLYEALKIIQYQHVIDFVKKKIENNTELAKYAEGIDLEEFLILELEGIYRYDTKNDENISKLFHKIFNETKNMEYIVRACLSITDRNIKTVDLNAFKTLNSRLEKYEENLENTDVQVLFALFSNNYFLNFIESEALEAQIQKFTKESSDEIPDCLTLENELKILNYLDKSMEYAMEILLSIKENPKQIEEISSRKMYAYMLENISTQYFVRGIANKDLEAKLMLWHFLQYDENPEAMIDIASFFIDNMDRLIGNTGHYICISKKLNYIRIEEILPKANKVLETLLEDISTHPENKQARVLNYMTSLFTYYLLNGRKSEGLEMYDKFKQIRKVCNIEKPMYICTIDAKMLIAQAEIRLKCFKKNSMNYLYNAIFLLQQIKTIYTDYSNNFQFLYRTMILKVVNLSLNRMTDVDYYTNAMLTIKSQAIKKGLFVKTLEIHSLSALRNLSMEKIDDAKADLKKMTKMLKLNDNILVETPVRSKPTTRIVNFENNEVTARKAIPKPSSRISKIEIFNDSVDAGNELVEQLKSFVHEYTCKCSTCKYPQLKFLLFQMGCHYSRLFFLLDNLDISKEFNQYALEPWRYTSMKILRSKECVAFGISKIEFVNFSIRWLFQAADTFLKLKNYSEIEEVLTEIELLCTSNIEDFECIKQGLHARMQNLEFNMKYFEKYFEKDNSKVSEELNFEEFLKRNNKWTASTKDVAKESNKKVITTKSVTQSAPAKLQSKSANTKFNLAESVIYIDSDDEASGEKVKPKPVKKMPAPKTTRSTRPKPAEVNHTNETPRTRLKRCL